MKEETNTLEECCSAERSCTEGCVVCKNVFENTILDRIMTRQRFVRCDQFNIFEKLMSRWFRNLDPLEINFISPKWFFVFFSVVVPFANIVRSL